MSFSFADDQHGEAPGEQDRDERAGVDDEAVAEPGRRDRQQLLLLGEVGGEEDAEEDLGDLDRLELRACRRAPTGGVAVDGVCPTWGTSGARMSRAADQQQQVAVAVEVAGPADDEQGDDVEAATPRARPAGLGRGEGRVAAGDHHVADAVQERDDRQHDRVGVRAPASGWPGGRRGSRANSTTPRNGPDVRRDLGRSWPRRGEDVEGDDDHPAEDQQAELGAALGLGPELVGGDPVVPGAGATHGGPRPPAGSYRPDGSSRRWETPSMTDSYGVHVRPPRIRSLPGSGARDAGVAPGAAPPFGGGRDAGRRLRRAGPAQGPPGGHRGLRAAPLHQPRAVPARLRGPPARPRRGRPGAAARAGEVHGDLRRAARRVLPGPGRRARGPGGRRRSRTRSADGLRPGEQLRAIRDRVEELVARQDRIFLDQLVPALADAGVRLSDWSSLDDDDRALPGRRLPPRDLPGADPARRRPGPPVPLHLEPLAQPGGRGRRPGDRRAADRPGEGPAGPAPLRRHARRRALRAARAGDRRPPRHAVPGHDDRRARRRSG